MSDEASKRTKRSAGIAVRDNLCIAAGFGEPHVTTFKALLAEWLEDRHPSVSASGYTLHILHTVGDNRVLTVHEAGAPTAQFSVSRKVKCAYGVYAAFADRGLKFFDLNTGCTAIAIEKDDSPDDTTPGVELLPELVGPGDQAQYADLIEASIDRGKFQLVYHMPSVATLVDLARLGGTGLLEPYCANAGIRRHVHARNLKVAANCKLAYDVSLRQYVERVRNADSEEALRLLGPPEAPHVFPRPPGATDAEQAELLRTGATSAFNAWAAIREKLDALWGMRSMGAAWFKGGLEFDTDKGAMFEAKEVKQSFGVTGKFKMNFEADSSGEIKMLDSDRSFSIKLGAINAVLDPDTGEIKSFSIKGEKPFGSATDSAEKKPHDFKDVTPTFAMDGSSTIAANAEKFGGSIKLDKDRMVTEFTVSTGPYKFNFKQDGTATVSAGFGSVTGNQNTGQVTISNDFSFRKFVLSNVKPGPDGKPPAWTKRVPELKVSWEAGMQLGPHQSDIMRVVAKTPGLWDMRPRDEFCMLAWSSLEPDEQGALSVLGFDQHSWDFKILPKPTKQDWVKLKPDQKMASLHLPVPAADPYWIKFWKQLQKNWSPVGDLEVLVLANSVPVSGRDVRAVQVRAVAESYAPAVSCKSDSNGFALFEKLMGTSYHLFVGAPNTRDGEMVRGMVKVARGDLTKWVIELPST